MSSIFDPGAQHDQVDYKLIASLDRIAQALKALMWESGKEHGLTPIQMQCLIFLKHHGDEKRRAGQLAKEFDVTPATVSQAIRVLLKKELIEKERLPDDARIQILNLTSKGSEVCGKIENWANALLPHLPSQTSNEKVSALSFLTGLIETLHNAGKISVARQCTTCRFFREAEQGAFYCKLLEKDMSASQLRVDCQEHEPVR